MNERPSYPFLQLARELDLPYGQVLLCADWYVKPFGQLTAHNARAFEGMTPLQRTLILMTLAAEREHQRAALAAPPAGGVLAEHGLAGLPGGDSGPLEPHALAGMD